MIWNYESSVERSTGYEDIMDILKGYSKEKYNSSDSKEKDKMIDEVCNIYQERNIFPITYFNSEGVKKEIEKAIEFTPVIKDNIVSTGRGIGSTLCNFMFPNLYEAYNKNSARKGSGDSAEWKFTDKDFFRKVVKYAICCDGDATPSAIMSGIRQVGTMPSNFQPMNAKAIYEKYCPKGGIIFDYSCGFGGRMTGALTSKNNYSYVGCEPNSKTYNNLMRLGSEIEKVTGRKGSYKVFKIGSEEFRCNKEVFDFAFSSPPYFDLEVYCDEPTQCYIRYPDIYTWFDKYVQPTIHTIYNGLKHGRYYAVNIADFSSGSRVVNYVDIWKDYSLREGFKYHDTLFLKVPTHGGVGSRDYSSGKKERIMVFYKE